MHGLVGMTLIVVALAAEAGCTAVPAADGETRIIQTTDLAADRILAEAALCRYPNVSKTLGGAVTVAIRVPLEADPRYQCLADAMAARSEDPARLKPTPAP